MSSHPSGPTAALLSDVSETSTCVTAKVHAPAAVIFDLLATPHRHHEVDASGTVGADEDNTPITKTGQVFRMNMTGQDHGRTVEYQTDNHVTAFTPNRLVEWAVGIVDGDLLGWRWRWDLEPDGDDRTKVSLTYDWAGTSPENQARFGVPLYDAEDLTASIKLLRTAVGSG
jgi:hypothetical protein